MFCLDVVMVRESHGGAGRFLMSVWHHCRMHLLVMTVCICVEPVNTGN